MMAMYGVPIIYEITIFPEGSHIGALVMLNPMTKIMNAYRDVFMNHQIPDMQALGIVFLGSFVLFLIAVAIFNRLQKGFAEQF